MGFYVYPYSITLFNKIMHNILIVESLIRYRNEVNCYYCWYKTSIDIVFFSHSNNIDLASRFDIIIMNLYKVVARQQL